MPEADPELQVTALSKEFIGASGRLPILEGVDLTMRRGEAVVITGPSGSGKSTLLYILARSISRQGAKSTWEARSHSA